MRSTRPRPFSNLLGRSPFEQNERANVEEYSNLRVLLPLVAKEEMGKSPVV